VPSTLSVGRRPINAASTGALRRVTLASENRTRILEEWVRRYDGKAAKKN
jgi:hypothetical protein